MPAYIQTRIDHRRHSVECLAACDEMDECIVLESCHVECALAKLCLRPQWLMVGRRAWTLPRRLLSLLLAANTDWPLAYWLALKVEAGQPDNSL